MTVASFLNTGFAFTQLSGVTDVNTIITAVTTMLTTTLSSTPTGVYPSGERWSLVSTTFTSPTDNGGRFMKALLARTSIVRLQFQISDPSGVISNSEIQIAGAGSLVNIYGGPGHLLIESNNAGTWETAAVIMTDPTPEPLASTTTYVFGRGSRDGGTGSVLSNNTNGDYWMLRYTGGTTTGASFYLSGIRPRAGIEDNTLVRLQTVAGSNVVAPMYAGNDVSNFGGNWTNCGKFYQLVVVDGNQSAGAILNIPIDTGITAPFQVLHLGPFGCCQLAMRQG